MTREARRTSKTSRSPSRRRRTDETPSRRRGKDERQHEEYFDSKSPPRKSAAVDSKMVGGAGIVMFLMTNFKKEIGQILVAISKIIGGS